MANLIAFLTFCTSSTIGMIMPTAPRSTAFWMSPSVASGTRINGIAGAPLHAITMCATS